MNQHVQECLLLSNRLPLQWDNAKKTFIPSAGGLVSAFKGVRGDARFRWYGLLPQQVPPETLSLLQEGAGGNIPCEPIFVEESLYDFYYNGFCNEVLWPLFHYEHTLVKYSTKNWNAYVQVNKRVAENMARTAPRGASVWVQDFHFMLVPELLKAKRPDLRIGYFLHIPFPGSEIFRQLPCRSELLRGLLAADLVGFHDLSYLNHFRSSVSRVLGIECEAGLVETGNHTTHLGVFPISIETARFEEMALAPATASKEASLRREKAGRQWILGIDRLDYSKGLVLKLRAFQRFLRRYPDMRGRVQFRQIVVPSRTDVEEYRALKERIDQLVGAVNGEFGDIGYVPVLYQYSAVDDATLVALYRTADALWVGSRRDGMNLVCLEYVATQDPRDPGVVLLSEFAGAHSTLSYALSINPWDVERCADTIRTALAMSLEERRRRMTEMQVFLRGYDSTTWAENFLRNLNGAKPRRHDHVKSIAVPALMDEIGTDPFVLFLDYDGTLVPIKERPELAVPDEALLPLLEEVGSKEQVVACVVSGRSPQFFHEHLLNRMGNVSVAANHGASFYDAKKGQWRHLVPPVRPPWYGVVKSILDLYAARTPGSFVEEKPYGLAWHYRGSPPDFADFLSKKLLIELEEALAGAPAHVMSGKKVVEVKHQDANKGRFVEWFLARLPPRARVVAVGDDQTDEDMFRALARMPTPCLTVKVGGGPTAAQRRLERQEQVRELLLRLKGGNDHG